MMVNFHWRSRRSATHRVSNETVFELGVNFLFIWMENTTIKHIYWHYLFLLKPSVKSESEIYLGYFPYIFCHVCKYSHIIYHRTVAPSHMQGAEWGSRKGSYDVWPTLQLSLGSNLIRATSPCRGYRLWSISPVKSCLHTLEQPAWQHARTDTHAHRETRGRGSDCRCVRSCTTGRTNAICRNCPKFSNRTLRTSLQVRHEPRITKKYLRLIGDAFTPCRNYARANFVDIYLCVCVAWNASPTWAQSVYSCWDVSKSTKAYT